MISLLTKQRYGPIGVDIGSRSVKLVQFSADHSRLLDAARGKPNVTVVEFEPADLYSEPFLPPEKPIQ